MSQLNDNSDLTDRLQDQIDQLKHENEDLKRDVEQLKRENHQVKCANDQLKQDAILVKQDNDRRLNSLNEEVINLKLPIFYYSLQTTSSSEHVNKRICQNQTNETEQITDVMKIHKFVSLPEDAIRLILIRLPLRHRVLIRIICHRCKWIIESMCRSVRLLLLTGPTTKNLKDHKEIDHNVLLIDMKRKVQAPNFHKGITHLQFIPQLFCNVDQVFMHFPKTFEVTIMQLLESLANRLTSLILDIEVGDQYLGEAIWHRITQMPKLKEFKVVRHFFSLFNAENCQLDFLGQLRVLEIGHWEDVKIIRFVGPNIRHLELNTSFDGVLDELKKRQTIFNLTHLNLLISSMKLEQQQEILQFVCRHFVSLIELKLCLDQMPFNEQLTQLSRLLHLTKFEALCMTRARDNLVHDLPRSIQFASLQSLVLNIWMKPMTPKQTKPRLINITERSRISKFLNEIPRMFPMLVELKIVACIDSTVKMIEELVNDSILKSTDKIKWELIGH